MATVPLVEFLAVGKNFGGVHALNVDLAVMRARWWPLSVTMGPANRFWSRSSPACFRRPPARFTRVHACPFRFAGRCRRHAIETIYQTLASGG